LSVLDQAVNLSGIPAFSFPPAVNNLLSYFRMFFSLHPQAVVFDEDLLRGPHQVVLVDAHRANTFRFAT
jgi:hypothetical protein